MATRERRVTRRPQNVVELELAASAYRCLQRFRGKHPTRLRYGSDAARDGRVRAVRECHDRLVAQNKGIDLSAYNTTEVATDYAEVRTALGIREWYVLGHSYGTYLAQELSSMARSVTLRWEALDGPMVLPDNPRADERLVPDPPRRRGRDR